MDELDIPDFRSIAFKYDILELNTNVKPTLLAHLLKSGYQSVIYFDPDIYIFGGLELLYEQLAKCNVLVTPHATTPVPDFERPSDQDFSATGVFNLGFIGVSNTQETQRFLQWWEQRCLQLAYSDTRTGLFVDQKWVDLAPCYFDGIRVLKHPGCNVASWNFHERRLRQQSGEYTINGEPLIFFHFSGIDITSELQISKNHCKYTLENRPEFAPLYQFYRQRVVANGYQEFISIPYGFGTFSNGVRINSLARRVFSIYSAEFSGEDPFDANGRFFAQAKRRHLLSAADPAGKISVLNYNPDDIRLKTINALFRTALTILGGARYTMLMKYLSYISILRNQRDVLAWKIGSQPTNGMVREQSSQ
ncbi:MAG TPA: hypothetical protein VKW78_13395 [Terriglobales bacterium]|nr:hypothetical protein [Terriglobales bacterium]